jgi:hypothetical protein
MKKLFLVVLYKCNIFASRTIRSFDRCGLFDKSDNYFYIWDNSPIRQSDSEIATISKKSLNFEYQHTPANISLAKIYNRVIEDHSNIDYFVLFDQDSLLLDVAYEEKINKAIYANPDIKLFLPQILSKGNILYSPGRFFLPGKSIKIRRIYPGVHLSRKLNGITSGLIIKNEYFKLFNWSFNEKLKLYGIDTDFFIAYSKHASEYFLLDCKIYHNLSFESNDISEREKWDRHCGRMEAFFIIYKRRREHILLYALQSYYLIKKYIFHGAV